jgi:hypothetical protein
MVKLTDEQVDYVLNEIKARGVTIEDLQYNLLDHMCCIIENEIRDEDDFYQFVNAVFPRFFNENLVEIEKETILLVTFKNYYAMKKTMYLTSIMVTAFMILFSLFKIFHLPGAGALFVITVVLFSLLFLPLVILIKLKDESKKTEKMVYSFGFLLGISTSIGVLFKLMHWPYAGILMLSGVSIFTFIYVPLYYITQSRTTKDKYQTILLSILMFTVGGLLFALFDLNH